jgi:hypothetical protein
MQKLQEVFTAGHEKAFAVNEDGRRVEVTNIGNGSFLLEKEAPADLPEQIKQADAEGRGHDAFELSLSTITFAVDTESLESYLNDDYDVKSSDAIWSPVVETVKA